MCPSFIHVVTCVSVLYIHIHMYTYIFKSFCVLWCFDILKMLPDWAATAPSRVSQFFVMARGQLGAGLWASGLSNPESYLLYVVAFTPQETILWCSNYPKTWYQATGDYMYSCKPTGVIQASQTSWSELFILPFPPETSVQIMTSASPLLPCLLPPDHPYVFRMESCKACHTTRL